MALTETVLLTKSRDYWHYETEYRIIARDRKLGPSFSLTSDDDFLALPEGVLSAVTVGAGCVDSDMELIKTLVDEYTPALVDKRATCAPDKFQMLITGSCKSKRL